MSEKIVLIGSGNLAEQLALALAEQRVGLVQIYGRNRERVAALGAMCGVAATTHPEEVLKADLYLVAVSDRAVGEVTRPLSIPKEALVAHTAGSVPIEVLPHARRGAFYPFQSFTVGRRVDFREIPIFLECSDREGFALLARIAEQISRRHYAADHHARRRIHLAGVFACNFVNSLYGVGEELIREAGFDFEQLKPLIRETALKALDAHQPRQVQTGPAVRGDRAVLEGHLALLGAIFGPESPTAERLTSIYNELSEQIWETSKRTF